MLRSAIENVVRNAIRYTTDGSVIEISLERVTNDGDKALLRIRDHGPGVPKTKLAGIFLPFQRVPTVENNSDGAGLGLAIADRVMQTHHGTIRALNANDGGLIVEIVLPVAT